MTTARQPDSTPGAPEAEAADAVGFEEGLAQLAALVASLEAGGLGLSESIEAYEKGVGLLRRLHAELAQAEERVRVLVRIDDEGRPVLADHDDGDEPAPGPTRSRGRSRTRGGRTKPLPGMDGASDEA